MPDDAVQPPPPGDAPADRPRDRFHGLSRAQVDAFARVDDRRGWASLAWTWGWIVAAWALYCARPGPATFAIGWVIVSGRHLALAILMHDAAHKILLRDRAANDRVGQWLTAYPIMLDVPLYRAVHLQHHRATWTEADPDLGLAAPFPITRASFARKVLRDLAGLTGLKRYAFLARLSAGLAPRGRGLGGVPLGQALGSFARAQRGFLLTNGLMLAGLTAAGHPEAYLLLWVWPALSGYSLVLRLRSIAEHAVVPDPADPLRQTRTVLASWWVRFLMAPHAVNFHLEHHLFMYVPHYRLPDLHRALAANGALEGAEVVRGYAPVFRKATSLRPGTATPPRDDPARAYARPV